VKRPVHRDNQRRVSGGQEAFGTPSVKRPVHRDNQRRVSGGQEEGAPFGTCPERGRDRLRSLHPN
jgi:hypothetical protein